MYEKLFYTLFASIFCFYYFQPWSTFIVELPISSTSFNVVRTVVIYTDFSIVAFIFYAKVKN